jgi:hypothetical protein
MLSTGTTDNTSSVSFDVLLDFFGGTAGKLSFDWAAVSNSTGNRSSSLRVYWSIDGTTFTEITGAQVLNLANNVAASGTISNVTLPAAFDNSSTARLRFYECNGNGGNSGSRSKISVDNLAVTAGGPLDIQTANSLPNAQEMAAYTNPLVSAGGVAPYSYAVTAGALPAGLTLNTNGTWAGAPNTGTAATYNFDVTVTDSNPFTFAKGRTSFAPNTKTESFTLIVTAPTAANAEIQGKVALSNGTGLSRMTVMLIGGSLPEPIYATTNSFGVYRFEDVPVGGNYVIQVFSRKYVFEESSRIVFLSDSIYDADFIGGER